MKALALLSIGVLTAIACRRFYRTPEQEVVRHGGSDPIACVRFIKGYEGSGIETCRDSAKALWVCARDPNGDAECVSVSTIVAQWDVTAEAANGAH